MDQLNFLHNGQGDTCEKDKLNYWKLFIDGASRNNPGPAGAGIYITKNGKEALRQGFYIGIKTNNQAEYLSLSVGLFFLKKHLCKDDVVMIVSDSQLLVRQILRKYKVKNAGIIPLFQLSNQLLSGINYNIVHVLRHENKDADEMANVGIDKRKKLPKEFVDMLHKYEIQI
ncbi:ribonuclease HI family protein [Candidatus Dependentiae bacterium]